MKLPSLPFTRDVAALLQKEIAAETAATAKLADMRAARARALLEDDIAVIEKHDVEIAALERQISIHQDCILALDARLHAEEAAAREKAYAADIATIERLLPVREECAAEAEAAMKSLSAAVRKYDQITSSILAQYPPGVPRPSYHLSLRQLGDRLKSCFAMPSAIYAMTRQPIPAMDFLRRAVDAADRADGFAAAEARGHSELIEELRNTRHVARTAPEPEEEAA